MNQQNDQHSSTANKSEEVSNLSTPSLKDMSPSDIKELVISQRPCNQELAERLINAKHRRTLGSLLSNFEHLNADFALKLLGAVTNDVANNLSSFTKLDSRVADQLRNLSKADAVAKNPSLFDMTQEELATLLSRTEKGLTALIENIENFDQLTNPEKYAEKIITFHNNPKVSPFDRTHMLPTLIKKLDHFQSIDKEKILNIALKSEVYHAQKAIEHIEKFPGMNNQETILKAINAKVGNSILPLVETANSLDINLVAQTLESTNQNDVIASRLDLFPNVDHHKLAKNLIENEQGATLASNYDSFEGLDDMEISKELIENRNGYFLAENLDKFSKLTQENKQELAEMLLDNGGVSSLSTNLAKFGALNQSTLTNLTTLQQEESRSRIRMHPTG